MIEIIKSDVYESFYMSNTTTDYELKGFSKKAESKMKIIHMPILNFEILWDQFLLGHSSHCQLFLLN